MSDFTYKLPSPTQKLESEFLSEHKINLYLKREDLIHPQVSGNKWRKLKFNLVEAKKKNLDTILTFGGAYSNHIVATAFAAQESGLNSIGVIRGDEFKSLNPSLQKAKEAGMHFHFVSRKEYKRKAEKEFIVDLQNQFGNFFLVPEGGANELGVKGCAELVDELNIETDYFLLSAGTGTTAAGILQATDKKVMVFPALKGGEGLSKDILTFQSSSEKESQLIMQSDFHFGGYAKISTELVYFVNQFYIIYKIPLDLIYTAKMMFGLFQLIEQEFFRPNETIVAIHTGGLQGNQGMQQRHKIQLVFG